MRNKKKKKKKLTCHTYFAWHNCQKNDVLCTQPGEKNDNYETNYSEKLFYLYVSSQKNGTKKETNIKITGYWKLSICKLQVYELRAK